MKKLIIFLLIFSLGTKIFSQDNYLDISNKILDFSIQIDSDSFKLGNPIIIDLKIKNVSNQDIYLPGEFNFTSNLFPNGHDKNFSGFNIKFDVQPMNNFNSIFIEDLIYNKARNFKLLKPNETWIIKYNLYCDFKLINSLPDNNPPAIMVNNSYSVTSTLTNSEKNVAGKTMIIGQINSNEIRIHIY